MNTTECENLNGKYTQIHAHGRIFERAYVGKCKYLSSILQSASFITDSFVNIYEVATKVLFKHKKGEQS